MVRFMSKGNAVSFNHRLPIMHRYSAILWILGQTVTSRVEHYWLKTTKE